MRIRRLQTTATHSGRSGLRAVSAVHPDVTLLSAALVPTLTHRNPSHHSKIDKESIGHRKAGIGRPRAFSAPKRQLASDTFFGAGLAPPRRSRVSAPHQKANSHWCCQFPTSDDHGLPARLGLMVYRDGLLCHLRVARRPTRCWLRLPRRSHISGNPNRCVTN